jgi:hypothetical protein
MTTADEQTQTGAPAGYADASIRRITADNGVEYAYRMSPAGCREGAE